MKRPLGIFPVLLLVPPAKPFEAQAYSFNRPFKVLKVPRYKVVPNRVLRVDRLRPDRVLRRALHQRWNAHRHRFR